MLSLRAQCEQALTASLKLSVNGPLEFDTCGTLEWYEQQILFVRVQG